MKAAAPLLTSSFAPRRTSEIAELDHKQNTALRPAIDFRRLWALSAIGALLGCAGIPPVNTDTISQNPATPQRYAAALQAVNICSKLPDTEAVMSGFEALGYKRTRLVLTTYDGTVTSSDSINSKSTDLKIIASSEGCTIGLEGMTPEQSFQLAQPWVKRFGLVTNESLGQGLSPHAVQAWQFPTYPHTQILASAGKTWYVGSGVTSDVPGASVRLFYER